MKKNWQSILTVIMAILLIVCLVQINSLTERVNQLNTNFSSQMNIVRESINSISWNVQNSLEQQASILSDSSWEYGEVNVAKKTAAVQISITPKEYDANTTHAYVSAGTRSFPLTLNSGSFVGTLELPLFQETHLDKVRFVEGNTTRTEKLDWYFMPANDKLARVYADFSYNYQLGQVKDGKRALSLTGDLNINIDNATEGQFKNVVLSMWENDKEIKHEDITAKISSGSDGASAVTGANGAGTLIHESGDSLYFYYSIDEDFDLENGKTYTLYCEISDENGLCYRSTLWQLGLSEQGAEKDGDFADMGTAADIYDSKGNLLYKNEY